MPKKTFVFDLTTRQWAQWGTSADGEGLFDPIGFWNANRGVFWRELQDGSANGNHRTVVGDLEQGRIMVIDPEIFTDVTDAEGNGTSIRRVVTGIVHNRQRQFVRQYNFRLTASVGDPSETGADVHLRFSDDRGNNWTQQPAITLQDGAWNQELTWRSLGVIRSPQRLFEITDINGLVRISDADAMLEGEDDE